MTNEKEEATPHLSLERSPEGRGTCGGGEEGLPKPQRMLHLLNEISLAQMLDSCLKKQFPCGAVQRPKLCVSRFLGGSGSPPLEDKHSLLLPSSPVCPGDCLFRKLRGSRREADRVRGGLGGSRS